MDTPRIYLPAPPLRPFVNKIAMSDFDFNQIQSFTSTTFPRGYPMMIIPYHEGLSMTSDYNTVQGPIQPMFIGQTTHSSTVTLSGNGGLIFILFHPYGMQHLFRQNMHNFTDAGELYLENIDSIYQPTELIDRLENASDDDARLNIIEQMLLKRILQFPFRTNTTSTIVDWINWHAGNIRVDEASEYFNTTVRTLERSFLNDVGISPKLYAEIVRFRHVIKVLKSKPNTTWLDLCCLGGFSDQSHLIKNVKKFTGETPENFNSFDHTFEDLFWDFEIQPL